MSIEKEIPVSDTKRQNPPQLPEDTKVTSSPAPEAPGEQQLKEELEELRKEKEQIHDLYLRKQAEFENFKKRLERDKSDSIRYANESLICEILPVVDHFELAIATSNNKEDSHSHDEGIKLIVKQLKDVLLKYGLTDVPTVGKPFDPAQHEAVLLIHSDEHPPNTVLEEQRKGYKLKGKLIRPAMVVVSKK